MAHSGLLVDELPTKGAVMTVAARCNCDAVASSLEEAALTLRLSKDLFEVTSSSVTQVPAESQSPEAQALHVILHRIGIV